MKVCGVAPLSSEARVGCEVAGAPVVEAITPVCQTSIVCVHRDLERFGSTVRPLAIWTTLFHVKSSLLTFKDIPVLHLTRSCSSQRQVPYPSGAASGRHQLVCTPPQTILSPEPQSHAAVPYSKVFEAAGWEFGSLIHLCYLLETLIFFVVNNFIVTEKNRDVITAIYCPSPNTLALSYQHCTIYSNKSPILKSVEIWLRLLSANT